MIAALLVAVGSLPSVPVWSLPIFGVLAALGGVLLGAKLSQVLVTFVVIVGIFPLGLLYLIGVTGQLSSAQTLSIIAVEGGATAWLLMLSPVVAAALTCIVSRRLIRPN